MIGFKSIEGNNDWFIATIEPNEGGLPKWTQSISEKGELIFMNNGSEVHYDPDREARKSFQTLTIKFKLT